MPVFCRRLLAASALLCCVLVPYTAHAGNQNARGVDARTRRQFLRQSALGLGALALGEMPRVRASGGRGKIELAHLDVHMGSDGKARVTWRTASAGEKRLELSPTAESRTVLGADPRLGQVSLRGKPGSWGPQRYAWQELLLRGPRGEQLVVSMWPSVAQQGTAAARTKIGRQFAPGGSGASYVETRLGSAGQLGEVYEGDGTRYRPWDGPGRYVWTKDLPILGGSGTQVDLNGVEASFALGNVGGHPGWSLSFLADSSN